MTTASDDAASGLRSLSTMDRNALALQWVKVFGCAAPRRAHAQLLRSALAWRYQVDSQRDVDVTRLVQRLRRQAGTPAPSMVLSPGTRLLREWHGITHHVVVTPAGFEYGGKNYRSLTAISREITGLAWSGPVFFGIKK